VLSLPPAFVLSQDQTLKFNSKDPIPTGHVLVKLEDEVLFSKAPPPLDEFQTHPLALKKTPSSPPARLTAVQQVRRPSKPSAMNSSRST
jgi:hypothetical protein